MGSQMKTAQMTRKELKYLERIRTMREKTSIFDDKFLPRGHRKKKNDFFQDQFHHTKENWLSAISEHVMLNPFKKVKTKSLLKIIFNLDFMNHYQTLTAFCSTLLKMFLNLRP